MFFAILAMIPIVFGLLLVVYKYHRDGNMKESPYGYFPSGGVGCFLGTIAAIVMVVSFMITLETHSNQVFLSIELDKIAQFEKTYQARADNLTRQFANYLVETYPQHEREIFSKIEPGKLDIYLVKYPELQASKTIMALVDQERSLRDDIYKQQLARAETIKQMRYNARSPWVYQWVMPNIPIPEQ